MADDYARLAPVYQALSRLVFGEDLIRANRCFLDPEEGLKSLILGGGDGLAYRVVGEKLQGEYWDLSPKMIQLAQKNLSHSPLLLKAGTWTGEGKFDRVYLPFVLDTMPDEEILGLLAQSKEALLPRGKVVVSDFFQPMTFRQKLTQQGMILFFRKVTAHRRSDLPDIQRLFEEASFVKTEEKIWRGGWIRAQVWQIA